MTQLLLGIDEAGYGPNLGPFVMSSACFAVHHCSEQDVCLWKLLRAAVRKATGKTDGRLVVDDSKMVYTPKGGLGPLEKNLWPFLALHHKNAGSLSQLHKAVAIGHAQFQLQAPYLVWEQSLPVESFSTSSLALLRGVMDQAGVELVQLQSCLVEPGPFNHLTFQADSKAAVPLFCVGELLRSISGMENVSVTIDRLGGRQRYGEQVAGWFPGEEVVIIEETQASSCYQVGKRLRIRFQVEADQQSFAVALASMLSKYWRELMMAQFNAWFLSQQPDLTPTAGYPLDATRFWNEAEPVRKRLQLENSLWWRER